MPPSIATVLKQEGSKNHHHVRQCLYRRMGVSSVEAKISIRFLLSTNGSFIAPASTLTEFCSIIRIGNLAQVGFLRNELECEGEVFSILLGKVLYSGAHAGDYLCLEDVRAAGSELERLNKFVCSSEEDVKLISMQAKRTHAKRDEAASQIAKNSLPSDADSTFRQTETDPDRREAF